MTSCPNTSVFGGSLGTTLDAMSCCLLRCLARHFLI